MDEQRSDERRSNEQRSDVRYEITDADARKVFFVGAGVLLFATAVVFLLYFLYSYFRGTEARNSPKPLFPGQSQPYPPEPRLEPYPYRNWNIARSEAEWELHHYQWIDRQHGIVTIPIDQAINLIAQHGIPPTTTLANPYFYFQPKAGDRLTGFEEREEPQP